MDYEIVFESERIYFVKVSEKLAKDYMEMCNDVEGVQQFISHDRRTYTYEGELNWIKKKLEGNEQIFSMIEKGTNQFIGNIEIMDMTDTTGELGIAITRKMQDKHYGQESIKRLIDYAFNTLGLESLYLNVYNFNPRGIKCYEKCGFVKDGPGKTEEDIHMIIKNTNK